jgi:Rrf2 family protein
MISKAASYAIQAFTYLAQQTREREYVPMSEIAEQLGIPYHFLKKIMAELAQSGLLLSQRSAKGGVSISGDASEVTLFDIITRIDGDALFTKCILSLPGCGEMAPCPLHTSWAAERARLHLMFTSTTLSDVAKRVSTKAARIKA